MTTPVRRQRGGAVRDRPLGREAEVAKPRHVEISETSGSTESSG
ncbi:hypothetical protein [Streptomyces phaeochromogenes]